MTVPSRPNSARTDAISTFSSGDKIITRVGYVPAEIQHDLTKGLQRPVYASPPRFFSKKNPSFNKNLQEAPVRHIYQRPKRFTLPDSDPVVQVRNLATEIQPSEPSSKYRRYPKQPFRVLQSASVTYKIALSNHQTRLIHGSPNNDESPFSGAERVGGFRPIQALGKHDPAEMVGVEIEKHVPETQKEVDVGPVTFLTEAPIEGQLQETYVSPQPDQENAPGSPSPQDDNALDDDAISQDTRYLYPKMLPLGQQRLEHRTQASRAFVGQEFIDTTEKYSIGQKRFIAQKYNEEYVSQLPSTLHRMERSNISKRCYSASTPTTSVPKPAISNYDQGRIQSARRMQANLPNVQVEMNRLAWEHAFVKKIDILSNAHLDEPVSAPAKEKQPDTPRRSGKRFVQRPQLASMYTPGRSPQQRACSAQTGNITEVRELMVASMNNPKKALHDPISVTMPQPSDSATCLKHPEPLDYDGANKQLFLVSKLAPRMSYSKAEVRNMCEYHRKTAKKAREEANVALLNHNVLTLFMKVGEQQANMLCEQYMKNQSTLCKLVLTRILHMCRQHMCMQYFQILSTVHDPFQPTQLFTEWENHCIVIRSCLQSLYRLCFFHLILDKLLYHLPDLFFAGILKAPNNRHGLSLEALRTCFMLKPVYQRRSNREEVPKLMNSLSLDPALLPDSRYKPMAMQELNSGEFTDLFPSHKQTIDLSLIDLSTAVREDSGVEASTNAQADTVQSNPDAPAASAPKDLPPEYAQAKFSNSTDLEYIAPATLEVAVALLSTIAGELRVFTGQTKWKPFNDGAFFCSVLAFVGACNFDFYYWLINPVAQEEIPSGPSSFDSSRVRALSYQNQGEAAVTLIFDYLCFEIMQLLICSYLGSSTDDLIYTKQNPESSFSFAVVPPVTRAHPVKAPFIDWSHLSLYDSLINTVSFFLTSCSKEEFVTEHGFLLQFNPQLSFRSFEAVAVILKSMPVHLCVHYFERICLLAFCIITFIKGAIVSAATRKVIATIFQGVSLRDPYTIANAYYTLSVCMNILLDLRVILGMHCDEATSNHMKFLSYLFSELCLISDIIVRTHCLNLACGLALGNLHMLFSSYPSDMSGMLPPFIFFFTGAEDARYRDISIDNEKTGIYLKYYIASFIMRLGISYVRYIGRLDLPVVELLSKAKVFLHLYQEYVKYREKYILIDEFCQVIFDDGGGLIKSGEAK